MLLSLGLQQVLGTGSHVELEQASLLLHESPSKQSPAVLSGSHAPAGAFQGKAETTTSMQANAMARAALLIGQRRIWICCLVMFPPATLSCGREPASGYETWFLPPLIQMRNRSLQARAYC